MPRMCVGEYGSDNHQDIMSLNVLNVGSAFDPCKQALGIKYEAALKGAEMCSGIV